jgi:hypothetical protein
MYLLLFPEFVIEEIWKKELNGHIKKIVNNCDIDSVLDFSYSMLLNCPGLRDAKVSHDWGNNTITIKGTSIVRTIHGTKKRGAPTK